jgi:hypothetical protein
MITLNTIVKRFEDFADNHFFIRSFSFGGPEDVDLEKFDQYPLLHLIYTGATYEDTTKTLDFEVYIFDLPSAYEDKNERQKEVVSDAEQCAEDILADIANGQNIFIDSEDYEIANASVTPLQEANSNVLAGVLLELSITLPYDRSACDAPINGVQPEGGGFVYQRRGLLRVLTQNGTVDVLSVNTIKVTNGTLIDEGNGVVSIDTGGGGGATNLDDLADVVITDPLDHDSLVYDEVTGDWINGAPKALDMPVFNGSGAIISKGALCKAIGTHGDRVSVGLFDLDVDDPKVLVGLATAQLAISGTGHVRTYGELRGISTNAYAVGTILYASGTPGVLSSTAGSPELAIAIVTRSQTPTGRLFIRSWTPNSGKAFRYVTAGGNTLEAEKQEDTLTLTAAGGMTITSVTGTDTITLDSARLDDDDVTLSGIREIELNGENLNIKSSGLDILLLESDGIRMTNPVIAHWGGQIGGQITLTEATDNGGNSISIKAPDSLTANTTYTLPSADGTSGQVLATNAAGGLSWTTRAANSFETIAVSGQSSIVADTHIDTLTIAAGTGITLTTNASTDTLTITNSGTVTNTFSTIAVSGQSDVVADSGSDTLTLVAGSNITLTTDAGTDSITIAASGGGGGGTPAGSTGQIQYNNAGAFGAEAALYYDATNNRLSVGGNAVPAGTITSRGAGTTTDTTFLCEDSGGAARFTVYDRGTMFTNERSDVAANVHSFVFNATKDQYWRPTIAFKNTSFTSAIAAWLGDTNTLGYFGTLGGTAAIGGLGLYGACATTASLSAWQMQGFHGSTAPTAAIIRFVGTKYAGSGSGSAMLAGLADAEPIIHVVNSGTNTGALTRVAILGSGAMGLRNTAPTSSTSLTVRGHGTGTGISLLVENSGGTARFTVRDDGAYAFAGGTVGAAQTGYTTFTNLTTDRTCDANATTVEELADILGTLIVDLKTKGIIAA